MKMLRNNKKEEYMKVKHFLYVLLILSVCFILMKLGVFYARLPIRSDVVYNIFAESVAKAQHASKIRWIR